MNYPSLDAQDTWPPLPSVSVMGHANDKLRYTFLAGVPKALSENSAHLHWLGVTASRKG